MHNSGVFPIIADLFKAIANPSNGLIELCIASQVMYKKAYIALLQTGGMFPIIADLFGAIANPNNGLIELRVASQL